MIDRVRGSAAALLMLMGAGCDRQSALPDPATIAVPHINAHPMQPPGMRRNTVTQERLEAGLAAMKGRVVEKQDGYAPVEVRKDARFFLHPSAEQNASITFDVSSIESLALAPYMEDFSTVADCAGSPAAGVANVAWRLDDIPVSQLPVDRNYTGTVNVVIGDAKRLTVEVDQGNGVPWCDWLSVGFVDVKLR